MRNRRTARLWSLSLTVFLASACVDITPPTESTSAEDAQPSLFGGLAPDPQRFDGGLDAEFVRIARDVPGFGGVYYDERGTLVMVLAGDAPEISMLSLEAPLERLAIDPRAQPVRVQAAQYSFIELDAMHRNARPVLDINGVVFTDADERANRVRIGVSNPSARAAVESELQRAGVPLEAVIISDAEPIEPMQLTLRDRVRPMGGGLQIWRFVPPSQASICTLGFNVRAPNRPNIQGFVTNSHCTTQQGVVLGTEWNQKQLAFPLETIAVEAHDPPFFQGAPCPEGRNCRYSDAAGAQFSVGVADQGFGLIHRTTAVSQHTAGPLDIDPVNPAWTIISETPFPTLGQTLHKTGRTTGWLAGPVIQTCINTNVAGGGQISLLCQDRVQATPAGGDSGSPVFSRYGESNDVSLVGILWGGSGNTYVLSSMSNLRFENPGPFGWITYPGQSPP
ncbi:MAG: hypothetical protein EA350_10715 [Gemmatimonadales bacterium]|nr:MAG: hypothetical protein EA350_10715 [Gemmatimonadales bacterium]